MSGGRSSLRLIEEILSFTPGSCLFTIPSHEQIYMNVRGSEVLYGTVPVSETRTEFPTHAEVEDASGGTANKEVTIKGLYLPSKCHFSITLTQIDSDLEFHRDWYLFSHNTQSAGEISAIFQCEMTGATAQITIRPPELQLTDWQRFEPYELEVRYAKYTSLLNGEDELIRRRPLPTRTQCLETFAEVLHDLVDSEHPRPIISSSQSLQTKLGPELLVNTLGFLYDKQSGYYRPPEITDKLRVRLQRMLFEVQLDVLASRVEFHGLSRVELYLQLIKAFNATASSKPYLSPWQYGVLGASRTDSAETLIARYDAQVQHDPRHTPYYFEALRCIATSTNEENLAIKVLELESLGVCSLSQVQEAFTAFGLDIDVTGVKEDQIIDRFFEAYHQRPENLTALSKYIELIGDFLGLQSLKRVAQVPAFTSSDCFKFLGLETTATDESVIDSAGWYLSSGNPVLAFEGQFALRGIAISRRSPALLSFYESRCPVPEVSLEEAYSLLGISPESLDDSNIVAVYEIAASEDSGDAVLRLRAALATIAREKDSDFLRSYLGTGSSVQIAQPDWPVGLWNIGCTCYLNSLLQFYYTIIPLRELLSSPNLQKRDDSIEKKKVGGRLVPYNEVRRSQHFLKALAHLFHEMRTTADRFAVPSEELAYMALVPAVEDADKLPPETDGSPKVQKQQDLLNDRIEPDNQMQQHLDSEKCPSPNSIHDVLANPSKRPHKQDSTRSDVPQEEDLEDNMNAIIEENGDLPRSMSEQPRANDSGQDEGSLEPASSPIWVNPSPKPLQPFGDLQMALARQQDVTECIENVLFQIEAAVTGESYDEDGEQIDLVKQLFYGQTLQVLQPMTGNGERREKREKFSSLLIDVAEGRRDIYDALDKYFNSDLLELSEGETLRTLTIETLPPILQIQIQRVQFDRESGQMYKSLVPLVFEDVVYLDRYLETKDETILRRREELQKWRQERTRVASDLTLFEERLSNGMTRGEILAVCLAWLETQLDKPEAPGLDLEPKVIDLTGDSDDPKDRAKGVSSAIGNIRRLLSDFKTRHTQLQSRLAELDNAIDSQFNEYKKHGYHIHSLFIHRGQASYGHYWIYIRDFATGDFLKYDDEIVTRVGKDEAMDRSENNTATPYYLVFIREDFMDKIKSIDRQVGTETRPVPDIPDVEPELFYTPEHDQMALSE